MGPATTGAVGTARIVGTASWFEVAGFAKGLPPVIEPLLTAGVDCANGLPPVNDPLLLVGVD